MDDPTVEIATRLVSDTRLKNIELALHSYKADRALKFGLDMDWQKVEEADGD